MSDKGSWDGASSPFYRRIVFSDRPIRASRLGNARLLPNTWGQGILGDVILNLREFTERYVVKAKELQPVRGAPPDAGLPRFNRDRFMVLGRNSERDRDNGGPAIDTGVNLAYIRCEPGTGFGSHKHPDWEILVTLAGTWRITAGDDLDVLVGPLDVVAVPGNVYHEAMNVGNEVGYGMSINVGSDTARFTIHPALLEELGLAKR
jgi:mannose-6-phosphate isomerase-like protein (cupin superfamily)